MAQTTSPAAYTGTRRARPLRIWPFTDPYADLIMLILALPLLWVLGFEQVLPGLVLALAFLKLFLTRRKLRIPVPAVLFLLFILLQLVSATAIDVPTNWFTFLKSFTTYLAGFFLFMLVVNTVQTQRRYQRFLGAVMILGAVATLIGAAFVAGLLPATFQALGADLIPGTFRASTFVQEEIIAREIGRPEAVLAGVNYRRISSIFLFPTAAALGYVILLPLQFYMLGRTRRWARLALLAVFLLSIIMFVLAASRTAWLTLPVSAAIFGFWYWQKKQRVPKLLVPAFVILLLILAVAALLLTAPELRTAVETIFLTTRADSFTSRMEVYVATLESLAERPLLGWGTPRAIPGVRLAPAGTHGEFIKVLYSFGPFSLLLYVLMYLAIWLHLLRLMLRPAAGGRVAGYPFVAATILLTLNINGLAHGVNFDLLVTLLYWIVIGLAYTSPAAEPRR